MSKLLYINCSQAGISGDMLLSSFAGLIGVQKMQKALEQVLSNLNQVQKFQIGFSKKSSINMEGYHLDLHIHYKPDLKQIYITSPPVSDQQEEYPHLLLKDNSATDGHNHSHNYSTNLMFKDLEQSLMLLNVSAKAKEIGLAILSTIIEAEANVHQTTTDDVHLHEIGAVDTIIDIVGSIYALDVIGTFSNDQDIQIISSIVSVGGGTVKCAHGILPVPAPATLQILKMTFLEFQKGPVNIELATPTGVAILGVLNHQKYLSQKSHFEQKNILKSGIGVGTRELEGHANFLRIDLCSME